MKINIYAAFILIFFFPISSCAQENEEVETLVTENENLSKSFGNPESKGVFRNGLLDEASGIAASRKYPEAMWVHNDSGNDPVLYLIDHEANILKSYFLEGIENRDWEDVTIGPGPEPNKDYLYLGDIGDNLRIYEDKIIYRFPEPTYRASDGVSVDTVSNFDVLSFSYPDQNQDAEVLMIDPSTQDLYIVAKSQGEPTLYRLPADQLQPGEKITAEIVGIAEISGSGILSLATAGDISPDGKEVLVKTYGRVFYWKRDNNEISISELLSSNPDTLRYTPEPQGEAITFSLDPDGFFTLSEKRFGQNPVLYFYPRK